MNNRINKKYNTNYNSKINIQVIKDILNISIPTTCTRLISSIGFFLEPILLTMLLIKNGYTSNYITIEYGIINSYVLPLLAMPTFFSISIASALLPNITKLYKNKNYTGDIVVAWVEGIGNTLKRFQRDGEYIVLHPENPDMEDIRVKETECRIQGVAITVIRKLG